jgi:hypothetical protein
MHSARCRDKRLGASREKRLAWRQIDRPLLEKQFPGIPVPTSAAAPPAGLSAIAERIDALCQTCDLCGGVVLDEQRGGVRSVDLWICPRDLD